MDPTTWKITWKNEETVKMTNKKCQNLIKRKNSLIVTAILLLVLVFGFFYELTEMGHECNGDDCPICSCIQHLNQLHLGRNSNSVSSNAILNIIVLTMGSMWITGFVFETPVERKVRLNN